jgi:hypothetical protein
MSPCFILEQSSRMNSISRLRFIISTCDGNIPDQRGDKGEHENQNRRQGRVVYGTPWDLSTFIASRSFEPKAEEQGDKNSENKA